MTAFSILQDGTLLQRQRLEAPPFPRGMTLAFGGSLLLIAGQSDTSVVSYRVRDGLLEPTGHRLTAGLPLHPAAFAPAVRHATAAVFGPPLDEVPV